MSFKWTTLPQRFTPMWGTRVVHLGVSIHTLPMILDYSILRIGAMSRKSTKDKEDQQVLSISSQEEENEKSVKRVSGTITKRYIEERSAKEPGRPVFTEMIADIEAGAIDAIVCWRLNRLARNPIDGGKIMWLLQKGILKAIITSEKVYLPSDNVIQMAVEFGMSTQFSIDLGKDVKRGMLAKVKAGWKPGRAPIGYMSDYGGVKGEKVIHKDPERFPIIRKCWDYLLTSAYTVEEIYVLATEEWGLTIQKSRRKMPQPYGRTSMYAMFTEPFYFGEFIWNNETYQGSHESMVTITEFDRAQEILGAKGKPRVGNFIHPYPGLIRCSCCKASVVCECKRKTEKRSGELKTYCYLRCSKRKKDVVCGESTRMLPKKLQERIDKVVADIRLPRAFTEWALQELQLSQKDRAKLREQELEQLHSGIASMEKKIDVLLEMRLSSPTLLSDDLFQKKMQALESEKKQCVVRMNDHNAAVRTWRDDVIDSLLKLEEIRIEFDKADPKRRVSMLLAVGSRIELQDGDLVFVFAELFEVFRHAKQVMVEAIPRLGTEDIGLSEMKEPVLSQALSMWSRLRELNPRPPPYHGGALPLS